MRYDVICHDLLNAITLSHGSHVIIQSRFVSYSD